MNTYPKCMHRSDSDLQARIPDTARPAVLLKKRMVRKRPKVLIKPKPGDDLIEAMVREHQERCATAASDINTEPPLFQSARNTGVANLFRDAEAYYHYSRRNIQILLGLVSIKRTHGDVQPFRYDELMPNSSARPYNIKLLERMEEKNRVIGEHLRDTVSGIDTGREEIKNREPKKPKRFMMNRKVMNIYKDYNVTIPRENTERWRLFRPRVYFDVFLNDQRLLGRIIIQLYTEAAPLVVLQIVRACMCKNPWFVIKRIFPDLWVDVELPLEKRSPLREMLEYNGNAIDHGKHGYVLSFSKDYLNGFQDYLNFSIAVRPLRVLNGRRVGFGRVIQGQSIIDSLQEHGTKNGKLLRMVEFSDFGFL